MRPVTDMRRHSRPCRTTTISASNPETRPNPPSSPGSLSAQTKTRSMEENEAIPEVMSHRRSPSAAFLGQAALGNTATPTATLATASARQDHQIYTSLNRRRVRADRVGASAPPAPSALQKPRHGQAATSSTPSAQCEWKPSSAPWRTQDLTETPMSTRNTGIEPEDGAKNFDVARAAAATETATALAARVAQTATTVVAEWLEKKTTSEMTRSRASNPWGVQSSTSFPVAKGLDRSARDCILSIPNCVLFLVCK